MIYRVMTRILLRFYLNNIFQIDIGLEPKFTNN